MTRLTQTLARLEQYAHWLKTMDGEHPGTDRVVEDIKIVVAELKAMMAERDRGDD